MVRFHNIIDNVGIKPLAAILGVSENHVRVMKARDSIPPRYWDLIVRNPPSGVKVWVTHDALRNLYEDRFTKKRSAL